MQNNEKKTTPAEIADLEREFAFLQRRCRQLGVPVLIVFEGHVGSGRGAMINRLIQPLDPRGYAVSCITTPTPDEQMRPFLWRFWMRLPSAERMAIFDRSWYWQILEERLCGKLDEDGLNRAYKDVTTFEKQLLDGNILIFKFFLEISQREQRARFETFRRNPASSWRTADNTPFNQYNYGDYKKAARAMIAATDTGASPWKVLRADHAPAANAAILAHLVAAVQKHLDGSAARPPAAAALSGPALPAFEDAPSLRQVDLSRRLKKDAYRDLLARRQRQIFALHHKLHELRIPVLIVYEGWDASGKGGNIRRLTQEMDPRGYEVVPTAAPTESEKMHHYLWRFYNKFPRAGHVAIFDRSWYGRVLVERVEGFCAQADWQRAYGEINEMEEYFCNFGGLVVKFWMHIDKEEQARRFEEREATPFKRWKMTEEDWRNREKWEAYARAVDEMFLRTHTPHAPWTAVAGNCKRHARIKTLDVVIAAIEARIARTSNRPA